MVELIRTFIPDWSGKQELHARTLDVFSARDEPWVHPDKRLKRPLGKPRMTSLGSVHRVSLSWRTRRVCPRGDRRDGARQRRAHPASGSGASGDTGPATPIPRSGMRRFRRRDPSLGWCGPRPRWPVCAPPVMGCTTGRDPQGDQAVGLVPDPAPRPGDPMHADPRSARRADPQVAGPPEPRGADVMGQKDPDSRFALGRADRGDPALGADRDSDREGLRMGSGRGVIIEGLWQGALLSCS